MKPELCTTLRVADGGRIVIPAEVRDRLGLAVGSELILTVEDDRATLMNAKAASGMQRSMRWPSHKEHSLSWMHSRTTRPCIIAPHRPLPRGKA